MYFMLGIIIVIVVLVLMKNTIVGLKNAVDKSAANIEAYLQQRFDIMNSLFAELERGLDHESNVFKDVTKMRANFNEVRGKFEGNSTESVVSTDKAVGRIMGDFVATSEAYPEIKGIAAVQSVMDENARVEREVSAARRSYNSNVASYRNALQMFPTNIIASVSGFKDIYELYKADAEAQNRVKPMFEEHYKNKYL